MAKSDYKKNINKDYVNQTYGSISTSKYQQPYSNISTSKLNTNTSTNRYNKFDNKRIETIKDNKSYSYNKDLITKKNYLIKENAIPQEKEKGKISTLIQTKTQTQTQGQTQGQNKFRTAVSENKEVKKLDFSKYYTTKKTEKKPIDNNNITYAKNKPVGKVNDKELYEYYPLPSSSKKTTTSMKNIESNKKDVSIDLSKYKTNKTNISGSGSGKFNLNNSLSSSKKGQDKLNIRYQSTTTDISEETSASKYKRNKLTLPSKKLNAFYNNAMAFFKLQFLTTKQVCEKFWNQIDKGELSISMFDQRNSVDSSRLSKFLSPEKNRKSKISMSNENTEISSKDKFRFSGNTMNNNINRKINFSGNEISVGKTRQSIKA